MIVALLLILAAILEVGGDALIRTGLRGGRLWALALGAVVLAAYGVSVNLPKWNFSKLMGVYIALFFVVAQLVSVIFFRERLNAPTIVGGSLIIAGGVIISVWHPA